MRNGRAKWALHVDIFEPSGPGLFNYPVVSHIFYGQTKKEADGYFRAHMGTDRFMRQCVESGHFADLTCKALRHWQKLK